MVKQKGTHVHTIHGKKGSKHNNKTRRYLVPGKSVRIVFEANSSYRLFHKPHCLSETVEQDLIHIYTIFSPLQAKGTNRV